MDFNTEDSDVEVFENNSTMSEPIFARTNSSSSSRKSSYEEVGVDDKLSIDADQSLEDEISGDPLTSPPSMNAPTVVEWKPQDPMERDGVTLDSSQNDSKEPANSDPLNSPQGEDLKEIYGSAVTVTIDPPADDNIDGGDDVVSRYLDGKENRPSSHGFSQRSLMELFEKRGDTEADFDLFESLNESDLAEEEDREPPPPTKICLLSK